MANAVSLKTTREVSFAKREIPQSNALSCATTIIKNNQAIGLSTCLSHSFPSLDFITGITARAKETPIRKVVVYGVEEWGIWNVTALGNVAKPAIIDKESHPLIPDKSLWQTCILLYIPEVIVVNGQKKRPTLNLLRKIINNPNKIDHKFGFCSPAVMWEYGYAPIKSGWRLITKDVLPESRNKSYAEQLELFKGTDFAIPKLAEMSIGILMHHAHTGECLFGRDPLTYTYCEERLSGKYSVLVGGMGLANCEDPNDPCSLSGLMIGNSDQTGHDYGVSAVRRF